MVLASEALVTVVRRISDVAVASRWYECPSSISPGAFDAVDESPSEATRTSVDGAGLRNTCETGEEVAMAEAFHPTACVEKTGDRSALCIVSQIHGHAVSADTHNCRQPTSGLVKQRRVLPLPVNASCQANLESRGMTRFSRSLPVDMMRCEG